LIDIFQDFIEVISSDFAVGVIAVALVIAIGLSYYGAKRLEEN